MSYIVELSTNVGKPGLFHNTAIETARRNQGSLKFSAVDFPNDGDVTVEAIFDTEATRDKYVWEMNRYAAATGSSTISQKYSPTSSGPSLA